MLQSLEYTWNGIIILENGVGQLKDAYRKH